MQVIDLNCDMGEGMPTDALIMPLISSANIACGFHAGDEQTMEATVLLAKKFQVAIGAHVSYPDRDNFGRSEMNLPPQEVYGLVQEQLFILQSIAEAHSARLKHVKPHGALYNMSARDPRLAATIAGAVRDFDAGLILFGLSNSHSITEAVRLGLRTASEVFADRSYREDGSLTPRSEPNALIDEEGEVIRQVLEMVSEGSVTATSGKKITLVAETICLHGDGRHAVELARAIYQNLKLHHIVVQAI